MSAPSLSMGANGAGVGVGNYKGVMLCNRPFAGTVGSHGPQKSTATTFNVGVVPESIGVNVTISSKERLRLKRPKKETVLSKHKKWLSDLQKTKDRLEAQYIEELTKKEEEKMRFQENQTELRKVQKSILSQSNSFADSKNENSDQNQSSNQHKDQDVEKLIEDAKQKIQEQKINNLVATKKAEAKSAKPAWAMTEVNADKVSEDKELYDDENLIDFAKNLDYDKYIADSDVQIMMERLRKRIIELESDVNLDEKREHDAEERQTKREMMALMTESLSNLNNDNDGEGLINEDVIAAKAVLQGDEDMQAIHSTKSVTAMLKSHRDKAESEKKAGDKSFGVVINSKIEGEPIIIVHDQNEGARVDGKNTVSHLPYIYRNPAV